MKLIPLITINLYSEAGSIQAVLHMGSRDNATYTVIIGAGIAFVVVLASGSWLVNVYSLTKMQLSFYITFARPCHWRILFADGRVTDLSRFMVCKKS
jgi:hypothetical protein